MSKSPFSLLSSSSSLWSVLLTPRLHMKQFSPTHSRQQFISRTIASNPGVSFSSLICFLFGYWQCRVWRRVNMDVREGCEGVGEDQCLMRSVRDMRLGECWGVLYSGFIGSIQWAPPGLFVFEGILKIYISVSWGSRNYRVYTNDVIITLTLRRMTERRENNLCMSSYVSDLLRVIVLLCTLQRVIFLEISKAS